MNKIVLTASILAVTLAVSVGVLATASAQPWGWGPMTPSYGPQYAAPSTGGWSMMGGPRGWGMMGGPMMGGGMMGGAYGCPYMGYGGGYGPGWNVPPEYNEPTVTPSQVSIVYSTFMPRVLTVSTGTTVTWANLDQLPHDVKAGTPTAPTGLFESPDLSYGETFEYTFTEPGYYAYYCELHPYMQGIISVVP
ncbi:MAG: plastocyanin/azurin family copper-binding protein [Candidatus Bathyarchaeia archaeon]